MGIKYLLIKFKFKILLLHISIILLYHFFILYYFDSPVNLSVFILNIIVNNQVYKIFSKYVFW